MPIYEYRCKGCKSEFEQLVRSSKAKVKCPKCGGRRVSRKLSMFSMSGPKKCGEGEGARSSCASCQRTSCAGCRG